MDGWINRQWCKFEKRGTYSGKNNAIIKITMMKNYRKHKYKETYIYQLRWLLAEFLTKLLEAILFFQKSRDSLWFQFRNWLQETIKLLIWCFSKFVHQMVSGTGHRMWNFLLFASLYPWQLQLQNFSYVKKNSMSYFPYYYIVMFYRLNSFLHCQVGNEVNLHVLIHFFQKKFLGFVGKMKFCVFLNVLKNNTL